MLPKRIRDAFKEYEQQGNKLSDYQIRLKKLIILATEDEEFGNFLDNGGFLETIKQYDDPNHDEQSLHRWLGILNDQGLPQEDFERNNLQDINSQWLVYLAFTASKHKDSLNRQKITDAFEEKLAGFAQKINESEEKIKKINAVADSLSKSKVLPAYAKNEAKNAAKHNKAAWRWLGVLIFVIIIFIPTVWLTYGVTLPEFNKLGSEDNSDDILQLIMGSGLAVKFLIIAAWVFVVRFVSKNYYAEKHLEQIALHRASVLKSLHAVYENIQNPEERDSLIKAGALVAFQPYETGYISRKEGAGETKAGLSDFLKK